MTKLIVPEWPLPVGVAACSSTRTGGVSQGAWGVVEPRRTLWR